MYDGRRREENEVSLPSTQQGAVIAAYRIGCRGERAGDPHDGSRRAGSLPGPGSFHLTRGARGGEHASGAVGRNDPYRAYGDRRRPSAQPTSAEFSRRPARVGVQRGAGSRIRRGSAPPENGPAPSEAREGPATSILALASLAACAVNPVSGPREFILYALALPHPAEGIVARTRFVHPDLGFSG